MANVNAGLSADERVAAAKVLLADLVAFDTTSHKSNLALVDYVSNYLNGLGIDAVRVASSDGQKANLFASVGPANQGGIALSGHTDVVPVDGQAWDTDPFALFAHDGKLYGRGTADMKGFVACALAMLPVFKARRGGRPIHVALSYDEEIGCVGVRPMIARFGQDLPRPTMVIVGEPTMMQVVDAHKGPVRWNVEVSGRAAHSSMAHLGVNAIAIAGKMLAELGDIERDLKASFHDNRFVPPYPTLQVTRIDGGTATNIVPVSCRLTFDIRALPGVDPDVVEQRLRRAADALVPGMHEVAPEASITITRVNQVPPFAADPSSGLTALVLQLARQNDTRAVSYATEAGLFQSAGSASIVCGPGDIAQAHTANEWIAESQLAECIGFLDRLAAWSAA